MKKRIKYSQNFLHDIKLVSKLLNLSSVSNDDIVLEIGAGNGIITGELLKRCKLVIAYEIDSNLVNKLQKLFERNSKLILERGDFIKKALPTKGYKVFSNIPFNITSSVIKKLTQSENPPEDTYLVIQENAAIKFLGKPFDSKNSQISILLKPLFEFKIIHRFKRHDFYPEPDVNVILLQIIKRKIPLISTNQLGDFKDLVVYTYNQTKPNIAEGLDAVVESQEMAKIASRIGFSVQDTPSELDFSQWNDLFNYIRTNVLENRKLIYRGAFEHQKTQQKQLIKIHRTRVDKDWRKYNV